MAVISMTDEYRPMRVAVIASFACLLDAFSIPGRAYLSSTPWLSAGRCGSEMDHFLEAFEDMFQQYGVDVFTSGHNHWYVSVLSVGVAVNYNWHGLSLISYASTCRWQSSTVVVLVTAYVCSYERTYPVYKRQPVKTFHQPNATVYVVNGAAGDIEGTQNAWTADVAWR
jgi:hypothetical protein